MSSLLPIGRLAAQVIAGFGVSKIVSGIIQNNVVISTTAQAVAVKTGGFILGSMLIDQSSKHIEDMITEAQATIEKFKNKDTEDNETVE